LKKAFFALVVHLVAMWLAWSHVAPWVVYFVSWATEAPGYALYVKYLWLFAGSAGAFVSLFVTSHLPSRIAVWVWVPVFLFFASGFFLYPEVSMLTELQLWTRVKYFFFPPANCDFGTGQSLQCIRQYSFTAPLYAGIAYSTAAYLHLRRHKASAA
jgi:hypothetical protein